MGSGSFGALAKAGSLSKSTAPSGEAAAASVRRPPVVTGTGSATVGQLIDALSDERSAATAGAANIPRDEVTLRGVERYEALVRICRELGVLTPEDPYPVWTGVGGPVTVAPLFAVVCAIALQVFAPVPMPRIVAAPDVARPRSLDHSVPSPLRAPPSALLA